MDYSSPLSSPPASTGYQSDGDGNGNRSTNANADRDEDVQYPNEASSEIDLVLTSPQVTPPPQPPVVQQRSPQLSRKPRKAPSKSASPEPAQEAITVVTVEAPAAERAQKSIEEPIPEPAKPVEENHEEPVPEKAADSAVEAGGQGDRSHRSQEQKPSSDNAPPIFDETKDEPMVDVEEVNEPADEPVSDPVDKPAEKRVDGSRKESATVPVVEAAGKVVDTSVAEPVTDKVDESIDVAMGEPVIEPADLLSNPPGNTAIVTATEETKSSPKYTGNVFAATLSSSPPTSPQAKRSQRRGSKTSKQMEEATKAAETIETAEEGKPEEAPEPPAKRSRARPKKETKENKAPARTPRKMASKAKTVEVEDSGDNNDDDKEQKEAVPAAAQPADPQPEAAMAPVTTTRSGRRVVRKHYGEDSLPSSAKTPVKSEATAKAAATTPAKAPAKTATKTPTKGTTKSPANSATAAVMRRRKQAAARWQTDFVLANTKSPLGHFDLRTLLCQPEAWDALDEEERKEVLALLPPTTVISDKGTADARPDISALKNDNNFRHDCARYRSDLQAGFFNKDWLEEAFEAHAMRSDGLFDVYVVEAFEGNWGVKVPEELKPDAEGKKKEEEKKVEAKEVPKTSLKRTRRPSKADEARVEVCNSGDSGTIEAKSTSELIQKSGTQPAETNTETDRSPKRQKQGDGGKVEVEVAPQGPGNDSQATFVPMFDSPVPEESVKTVEEKTTPTVEIATEDTVKADVEQPAGDNNGVTMDTALSTVEDAPTVPAKRKASVDIADSVDVPMRSRKRMTPSVGATGEAQGQDDDTTVEKVAKVDE